MEANVLPNWDWRSEAEWRLRERAAVILPGGRVTIVLPDDPDPFLASPPDAVVICTVCRVGERGFAGCELAATRPFKVYQPLYRVLATLHPLLAQPFKPEGAFHRVGERLCGTRLRGYREEYWVRKGEASRALGRTERFDRLRLACVTVLGIGFLPIIGATLASLVTVLGLGLASAILPREAVLPVIIAVASLSTGGCVLLERWAARYFMARDAREFVLDEVAGMATALIFVQQPAPAWSVGLAFLAFRFFDVLKPGLHWIETRGWPGAIVWDDVAAGCFAGVAALGIERLVALTLASWL